MPTACPDCGGSVEVTHVASQYQEEIPEVRPIVRRFDIEVGRCSQCRRRVQGRHALQTSDALGAAGAQLGPGVVALVVELHTEMGVPLAKVAHVLRTTFGLHVTPGGLAHLLHRTARDAAPTYTALWSRSVIRRWLPRMKPGGASAASATGCGPSSPRRRWSTPFAPVAGSTMPPRFWGPTSPVCSCATGGCLVIGKVLNHAERGVTAVYDRHVYDAEKRAALDGWARDLRAIVGQTSVTER